MSEAEQSSDTEAPPVPGEDVVWRLAQAGLPAPPLPAVLAPHLRAYGEWCFSTFEPAVSPRDLARDLAPSLEAPGKDFLLVAIDGFGVNSWAFHYLLNLDGLTCILQKPWGGMADDDGDEIAEAMAHIERLLDRPEVAGERLIIIDTFDESGWSRAIDGEIISQGPSSDPLRDAAMALPQARTAWRIV